MRTMLPLAVVAALAGCALPQSNAPSLLPRPIESRSDAIEAPPAAVSQPADPALAARIAGLIAQTDTSKAEFDAALPAAERAVRAAGKTGSESWVAAQQLVSALEVAHGPVAAAATDLDSAYVAQADAAGTGGPAVGLEELRAAQDHVAPIAAAQQTVLDRIKSAIGA